MFICVDIVNNGITSGLFANSISVFFFGQQTNNLYNNKLKLTNNLKINW